MSHQQTSTSPEPMPKMSLAGDDHTSRLQSMYITDPKQRNSLITRLRTASSASRPYSQPLSISLLAETETSSSRYSWGWRQDSTALRHDRPESAAKSILARGGRMLKRHGSKLNLTSYLLEEEPNNSNMEVSETCQRPQQSQRTSKAAGTRKKAISLPFDFHHVTHTKHRHFERLERGTRNELINEFVAIRAAQRPKSTLQGIQATDLQDATHMRRSAGGLQLTSSTASHSRSPADEQRFQAPAQTLPKTPEHPRCIRSTRSIENFSRPAPWSARSPISPPPRTSSRSVCEHPARSMQPRNSFPRNTTGGSNHQLLDGTKAARRSHYHNNEPNLAAPEANLTVNGCDRPSTSPALLPPHASKFKSNVGNSTKTDRLVLADIGTLTTIPLRHGCSFPTVKTLSQNDHRGLSINDQQFTEMRSESLQQDYSQPDSAQPDPLQPVSLIQPASMRHWEEVVDYSYEQAAEADCNFDWSQKTVYVDEDIESIGTATLEAQPVDDSASSNKNDLEISDNPVSMRFSRNPSQMHATTKNNNDPEHTSQRSIWELEDRLSPFGRHQSSSEFRGYQHLPQKSSKSSLDLCVFMKGLYIDPDSCIQEEAYDCARFELPTAPMASLERSLSQASSLFGGLHPLQNKYSSDGSLLSSTPSTIRTYRSSNSVSSLPELIYSLNNSRESFGGEKQPNTEVTTKGLHLSPLRSPSDFQSQLELEKSRGFQVIFAESAASELPSISPISPIRLPEISCEPFDNSNNDNRGDLSKAKAGPVAARKRSATAVTPGRLQPVRGSYSLFPPQQSPDRRP
ncbi:hypothetical protein EPUS_06550 [Endocarpon pusillum Z07020]|uniref:CRIB domain-containing protein n=1 Tax=Endocarpon pusillum (strain Z07020 / HMAS-L-300199) TaxID=1263415 RepID=U1HUU2_ENDPU|nr:uncharacterized protein EPUS_06550 [Endocarpon pusillum Z07020]ERF73089.1 hypothetical protein EPUS_06550 [Endocarpon pusillum Z07020]